MNRRAFLKTGASAASLLLSHPGWCAEKAKAKPGDQEILAESRSRIEKHRKAEGTIVVRDAAGKAVPNAKIKVEQIRHEFLFGCNLFQFGRCGDPGLEEQYRARFAALFNYCTLGFYWATYERERGQPHYAYTDQVTDWTRQHGITCKGHPLVWDNPAGSPRWLPEDRQQIARLSDGRVRDIVSRYKGRIDVWDVVNEPTHLADKANHTRMAGWGEALGAVAFVEQPLKIARAANPGAMLVVNDYRTDRPFYRILERLRETGKFLFDAIGIQSHMHNGVWPLHQVWDTCDTYAELGPSIHFTETTVLSGPRTGPGENWGPTTAEGESRQADQTAQFYTALFAHPAVHGITWWDFSDRAAWQRAAAGWLRRDMSPKPVHDRLLSLIKGEWWTRTEGTTDPGGECRLRAFYGAHRLTAELPGGRTASREVAWERAKPNRFELNA